VVVPVRGWRGGGVAFIASARGRGLSIAWHLRFLEATAVLPVTPCPIVLNLLDLKRRIDSTAPIPPNLSSETRPAFCLFSLNRRIDGLSLIDLHDEDHIYHSNAVIVNTRSSSSSSSSRCVVCT